MEHRRVFDRPTPNAFDCEVSDMFHETAVPARPLISVPRPRRRKEVRDPYDGLRPWSAITHGIGAALAVVGTVFLAVQSAWMGKWGNPISTKNTKISQAWWWARVEVELHDRIVFFQL